MPSPRFRDFAICVCLIFISAFAGCAKPDGAAQVKRRYEKQEYRIPMRDGAMLHTTVYAPRDRSKEYPILLMRTPYGCTPYGNDEYAKKLGLNPLLVDKGYIFVTQDVRGSFMSDGKYVNMRPHIDYKNSVNDIDESSDTYDTIEWLINNVPNNNRNVGMWGISYPGFYAAAGMIDAHPALKAVSPQAPIADWWYDDFHHHGAFFLSHAFRFFAVFGHDRPEPSETYFGNFDYPTPDGYQFFFDIGPLANVKSRYFRDNHPLWNDVAKHQNYDEYWQARSILPHLNNVAPAVMVVGGWYDAEDLYGPLMIYRSVEAKNPNVDNVLVMGPWIHGGWSRTDGDRLGDIEFGAKTSEYYQREIELPFFEHHLRGADDDALAEANVFETGTNRWRKFDTWPPAAAIPATFYIGADNSLVSTPPNEGVASAFDEFISDPAKPVPFTEQHSIRMPTTYMTEDQRFAARRPDVLVYQTEPLDSSVTIAGPLTAQLWVSTSQTDADWIVKLVDVLPPDTATPEPDDKDAWPKPHTMGGYQMMVRSEVIRGRFRNSHEKPEPFEPNQPTLVRLPLQDVLHTFQPGHRIMIQIQSTWFPLVDRNPQKYVSNIFEAAASDFVSAHHRVYRSPNHPTRIEFAMLQEGHLARFQAR